MKGLNKVMLIGNVGSIGETKILNENKCIKLSLATSETHKNKEGIKKQTTQWHTILCWNALADIVEKYVSVGNLLHVQGKIIYRNYNDAQENQHTITEIIADEIIFFK